MNPSPSQKPPDKTVRVVDFVRALEALAPSKLAESWDNVGLQIGRTDNPVKRIWVALDPSSEVVEAACQGNADLLICHHPLTLKGVKQINFDTQYGRVVRKSARHGLSILSAHTNLDISRHGLNDMWAELLGVTPHGSLGVPLVEQKYKLVVFVPVQAQEKFIKTLGGIQGAGRIGDYDMCTFRATGIGSFRAGAQSQPFVGKAGELSQTHEVRVETVVTSKHINDVIETCRQAHPYETMAYDVYPLKPESTGIGLGRIAKLSSPIRLADLAKRIKKQMKLSFLRCVGSPNLMVDEIALCTGSGGSLLPAFFQSSAQVFVSGDLRYHEAREIEQHQRGFIDVGHFASEHIMVTKLAQRLANWCEEQKWSVHVHACDLEKDPFCLV